MTATDASGSTTPFSSRREREDQRREWALWILYAADLTQVSPDEMMDRVEYALIQTGEDREPVVSEHFEVPSFAGALPTPETWQLLATPVRETVRTVEKRRQEIDEIIAKASPRWRIDRMSPIDRTLLRMGVAEMLRENPRPHATFNGLIELAKRYGGDTTSKFVNGILDEIRRALDIPFR